MKKHFIRRYLTTICFELTTIKAVPETAAAKTVLHFNEIPRRR